MSRRIRYLVIPAAGLGKRMKTVHPNLPKELLKIGQKPAIQYAIEEGLDAKVDRIFVVLSPQKQKIREFLQTLSVPTTYLYQEKPIGEAHAVSLAERAMEPGDYTLAVLYPDNIYLPAPGALKPLVDLYEQRGKDALALTRVTRENADATPSAGKVDLERIEGDLYEIKKIHPKTPGRFRLRAKQELRACGLMVSGPHLFEAMRNSGQTEQKGEITDGPVKQTLIKSRGMLGLKLPGQIYDIGNPKGFELCRTQMAER